MQRDQPTAEPTNVILVLALWGAGLGAAAQFGKIAVMFDLLTLAYPGRGAGIGFMVSIVGLVGLVFGTTAGLFVQRLGYRRVLVSALALGALMSALQAMQPGFAVMMVSRVAEGFSHLAIVVAGPTLIAQVSAPRHQGLAMTLWSSFFGISFALTAWLGLPLAQSHGPQALFLAHSAYMAGFAVLLWRLVPPDRAANTTLPLSLSDVLVQHGAIYRSPRIAAPALGFVFYTCMYVALLTLLPPMLQGHARIVVASGMPLASIAVSLTLGVWLLRHIQAVAVVQLGLAGAAVSMLALWLVWGSVAEGTIIALCLLLGGTLGLVQGASFAAIPQLNADAGDRARAAGAVAQLGNLGTTSGTPLLAMMIGGFGATGLLGFVLPLCLGGIAMNMWQAQRRKRWAGA